MRKNVHCNHFSNFEFADPDRVDGLLLNRLSEYLGSLSLNVKIMDRSAPLKFAKTYLGDNAASGDIIL